MRRYDLGEGTSGASDIIRYDAGKVAEFIADMEACMSSYNTKASALESEYSRYYNNHTYVGKAAEASKEFINNGQIERLHYGHHFLMERLYKRYVDIDEAFKAIVDRAPNARVDTEVMKKDKRDFCVYSDVTTDDSLFIENYAEEIKKRFEKYLEGEKGVRVPDYKPARRSLEELCGDGGQIDKSIKKCFEFDQEALSAINRSGLEEQIYDLTEDITNTARVLDGFKVFSPDVAKTSVSLLSLNNVKAITAFNALNPNRDNNAEVIQLAKLLNIKCSLNTVVDKETINTAAELMMLNCKTDQEKVTVQQCAAMMSSGGVQTIESLLKYFITIPLLPEIDPVVVLVILVILGVIALSYQFSETFPADRKDDGVIIEVPSEQDQKHVIEGPITRPNKEPLISDFPPGEVEEKKLGPGEVFQDSKEDAPKITTIEGSEQEGEKDYHAPKGGGGVTAEIQVGDQKVTFGHGGRHLEGTNLDVQNVNQALAEEVASKDMKVGEFSKGQIEVDGQTIEYTSYRISEDTINIGTYYPISD